MSRGADGSAGDVDYSAIGAGYAAVRQPDPRIAAYIDTALGDAKTVLNVGAGAGSYEPVNRLVTAIEPSATMRAQRPSHLAHAIDATSQDIPFPDDSFDAAMASVTVHQWPMLDRGLSEVRRVATGAVAILTFDPVPPVHWWLMDYVPELLEVEARRMPPIATIQEGLGGTSEVRVVPIPADCTDRFGQALFGRPEQLLDPAVRRAMSAWSFLDPAVVESFQLRLASDLKSGEWDRRFGHMRTVPEFDGGLRLIVAHRAE